jgi:hypothetical protein
MKTTDSLESENIDRRQQPMESAKHATPAPNQTGDQPSPSSASSLEVFYDGREVYGGY